MVLVIVIIEAIEGDATEVCHRQRLVPRGEQPVLVDAHARHAAHDIEGLYALDEQLIAEGIGERGCRERGDDGGESMWDEQQQ